MESLAYVLLYLLRGQLPWMNQKANNQQEKYEQIKLKKINTPLDVLCKGYPAEFQNYLEYVRKLKFEECPNYEYLRSLFKTMMAKHKYEYDFNFDWKINEK